VARPQWGLGYTVTAGKTAKGFGGWIAYTPGCRQLPKVTATESASTSVPAASAQGRSLDGIHAEKLTDPDAVTDALGRCVDVVRGGCGALLQVRVTPI
jgi:hypothetical protein